MYANIIIDITHEKLDRIFQYSVPPELEGTLQNMQGGNRTFWQRE